MVDNLTKLKAIYANKKVFLTGHTGFKGSWMLKVLSMLGAEVMGYALAPDNEFDLYHLLEGDQLNKSVIADIRDREKVLNSINGFQPDFVFHLAAQPLVRLSYEMPSDTFEINAIGTANILDGIRKLEKECQVILITTDKVYHNEEWVYPYRETDRLGGYDPYSASKACAELVIDSYRNSYFNTNKYNDHHKSIAVVRAGNVIGGGDWSKDRLIPDIAKALAKQEPVVIRNPASIRPWQHVLEPIFGYLLLGSKMVTEPVRFSDSFNFGPEFNDALPVKNMVEQSLRAWGSGSYQVLKDEGQPHEAGLLKLDINKAVNYLGWKPTFNAERAIENTMSWYKNYLDNPSNIIKYTEQQIAEFLNK